MRKARTEIVFAAIGLLWGVAMSLLLSFALIRAIRYLERQDIQTEEADTNAVNAVFVDIWEKNIENPEDYAD